MTMEFIVAFAIGHGRLARSTWFFRLLVLAMVCTAFGMLASSLIGDFGAALFSALFLWCAGAVSVKRLHDIGRSGWSLLSLLVPILGPLWLLLQLMRRGVEGRNRYGLDPLSRLDYLKVDITR